MAELTIQLRVLEWLRQWRFIYLGARQLKRCATRGPVDALRLLPFSSTCSVPRGFFSAVEMVRGGQLRGRIAINEQRCTPYPPGSLVKLSRLGQDEHQPWPVFWCEQENVRLVGSSLAWLDEGGKLCAESTFSRTGDVNDPAYVSCIVGAPTRLDGNFTSIVSRWAVLGYWHWLMDGISRLNFLDEFPRDTRILVPSPLSQWMRWFLDALGLEGRYLPVGDRNLRVEKYYFSAPSAMTGCYNPLAVEFLRASFLKHQQRNDSLPRRFYIVREGWTRGVTNETEVREFFRNRGWGLIAPEKLSIPEQIGLFARAEFVVGMHGSALTNILWMNAGARVLELTPENFLAGAFEILTHTVGCQHDFLICPADARHHITVDLRALEEKIDQLLV